jgi:riboflavin synthase
MFTGIIEALGTVRHIEDDRQNRRFWIESPFFSELKIDQSVAHDGVCLTVEGLNAEKGWYSVVAVAETLNRSHLKQWQAGHRINLERCMKADSRVDGHFVQGHVDDTATLIRIEDMDGSWGFTFRFAPHHQALLVPKGSVAVNGISLTVASLAEGEFSVAVIPYTYAHTNLSDLEVGALVNIEFDILGKYIIGYLERRNA